MNIPLVILILVLIVLIIYIVCKINTIKNNDKFQSNMFEIKLDTVNNLEDLSTSSGTIFVGADSANKNTNKNPIKVNNDVNIGTNNTIFIKDGINLTGNGSDDKYLDIDYIRRIKYLPYHFEKEICIGDSCVNKQHLKFMKGKIPFSMITFTSIMPFQIYSETGYTGWKTVAGTNPKPKVNINGGPMKSIQITSDIYKVTCFSEENYGGKSYDIESNTSDLLKLFPNGVKSMIPKSKMGNVINNTCLGGINLQKQPRSDNIYAPIPCDTAQSSDSSFFYIQRDELLQHNHSNDPDAIHFHDHRAYEEIHRN